ALQIAKNPRVAELLRPEHREVNPLNVTAAEWRSRLEAAAATRLLSLYGFGEDLAAQCVMVRVAADGGGHEDAFLMPEWGPFFDEATASSLVKVTFDGDLVDSSTGHASPADASVVNMGCVPVAAAIFRARREVNVILHTHPVAVMAVGGTKDGLLPLSQAAFFLHGVVGRYKYDF
ncbi:unnamed protein product, partial [Phaeothamnion confervicola]